MKCWAMAYLQQLWHQSALVQLNIPHFANSYSAAVGETINLCHEVKNNCFVNATYDPSRKGSCPAAVVEFHAGFQVIHCRDCSLTRV